jgi:hypothetical protein
MSGELLMVLISLLTNMSGELLMVLHFSLLTNMSGEWCYISTETSWSAVDG